VTASPAEVFRQARIVILMLFDDAAIDSVLRRGTSDFGARSRGIRSSTWGRPRPTTRAGSKPTFALQIGSPATAPAHPATAPAELEGMVLQQWPGPAGGRPIVLRAPPDELEALRQLVASTALERKAPKLEQAR
jgi:3-hydroxyisobutyrate dehydrogenase